MHWCGVLPRQPSRVGINRHSSSWGCRSHNGRKTQIRKARTKKTPISEMVVREKPSRPRLAGSFTFSDSFTYLLSIGIIFSEPIVRVGRRKPKKHRLTINHRRTYRGEKMTTQQLRLLPALLFAATLGGCDFIGDVLEVGFWIGVIAVVIIVLIIWGVVKLFK